MWLFLSLATAFLSALEASTIKKLFGSKSPLEMAAFPVFYALPLLVLVLPFTSIQSIQAGFWMTLIVLVPVNVAGFLLHMAAINLSAVSLTMPLLAFTPLFVIATGFLILGESISVMGALGIFLIVGGSYLLSFDPTKKQELFHPFLILLKDRGCQCMIGASFMYGFASVLGRKMTLEADWVTAGFYFLLFFSLCTLVVLFIMRKTGIRKLFAAPGKGLLAGALLVVHVFCHFGAIAITKAAVMIAIKRLNGFFSVVLARVFFQERDQVFRLSGSLLMFGGAVLLVIWQ